MTVPTDIPASEEPADPDCPPWCRADLLDPGEDVITHVGGPSTEIELNARGLPDRAESVEVTVEQIADGPAEVLLHWWPQPGPLADDPPDIALSADEAVKLGHALINAASVVSGRPPADVVLRGA